METSINNNMETTINNNTQTNNNMETTTNSNTKQFSSAHPGLIVYALDQSGSMSESYPEGGNKANFVHRVVNRAINELINANADGETIKDRAILSLIGFGGSVTEIRTDKLSAFANNPLRIETATQKVSDGNGGLVEVTVQNPIYFEPVADGLTPLAELLDVVKQIVSGSMKQYPDSPAPVINIVTDGMPRSKDVDDEVEEANAIAKADEIKALTCIDGHPSIFLCHLGTGNDKCELPDSEDQCKGKQSKFSYRISTELTKQQLDAAKKLELNVSEGSHGMICDADPVTFIKFINFGSSGANQDRTMN